MKTDEQKSSDRRKNFRVTCPITVSISLKEPSGEKWLTARVLDLSLGGLRVALEIDEAAVSTLTGRECSVRFQLGGKRRTLPGRFVGIYGHSPVTGEKTPKKEPLEAGIRFEGLSVDDQFILVDLFGKKRSPIFF